MSETVRIDLWMEGFRSTGDRSGATFCGTYEVTTPGEAIMQWAKEEPSRLADIDLLSNPATYWGCRFFDNEADARKSFG